MIDICVVNYNTKDKLERLLDTLHKDDNHSWNLWLEDNGSTDGSGTWIRKNMHNYRLANVNFNNNIGYSAACNKAASQGAAPIIGLLNGDVWLTSTDVGDIIRGFDDPDVSILGPKQRDERGRITHAGIFGSHTEPKHRDFKKLDTKDKLHRRKERCLTVSGSAYFIRRTVWDMLTECKIYRDLHPDAVGAFLPTPHYYEETWCSYHAWAHGCKIYYDGNTSIGHSWHASSPVGGEAEEFFSVSREIFRQACVAHSIPCD